MKISLEEAIDLIGDMKNNLDRISDVIQRNAAPAQHPPFDPDPMDPRNKKPSKQLSERGVEVLYRLYDRGATPKTAAALIGVSHSTAQYRHEWWEASGGINRERRHLEP